jgi:hypothetical protein
MQFWSINVAPKYLNFATFSKDLLAKLPLYNYSALHWRKPYNKVSPPLVLQLYVTVLRASYSVVLGVSILFLVYLSLNVSPKHFKAFSCYRWVVRFQVLTATSMKMAVFWEVEPCSLVEVYRRSP